MSNSLYASLFSSLFAIKHLSKKVFLFVYLSVNLFDYPFDHPSIGLPFVPKAIRMAALLAIESRPPVALLIAKASSDHKSFVLQSFYKVESN